MYHNQRPAIYDIESKSFEKVRLPRWYEKSGVTPSCKVYWRPEKSYKRRFEGGWLYLHKVLSPTQFKVASYMEMKASPFTNSLEPLSDKTSIRELAKEFGVGVNTVKSTFNKLFEVGVYGRFEVGDAGSKVSYWIFNPFLSFNGDKIDYSIVSLFKNTAIGKHVSNIGYAKFTSRSD